MKTIKQLLRGSLSKQLIVGCILILAFILRFHNYAIYPQRGASSDEYTYTFMGLSLLQKGVPTSWSYFQPYYRYAHTQDLTINHLYFLLVTPYFDHPPLNGIIVGGWALFNGEKEFTQVSLATIRIVPIFLGVISTLLVYLLAKKLYDDKTALWSMLIYATSTIIVMNTRVVFAENLLTPLLVTGILLFLSIKKKATLGQQITLGIISGLGFWTKELGVVIILTVLAFWVREKMQPKPFVFLSIFIVFFLAYGVYGYIYNWELFKAIIAVQSTREIGPETLRMLLFNPIIVNKPYLDGWYLFGFFSFFVSLFNFEKHRFIIIPAFIYFFLLLFSLTKHGEMGWYMISLFPFFSILSAALLVESIKQKSWYIFVCSTFIGMYLLEYFYEGAFGLTNTQFRISMLLLFLPSFFSFLLHKEKLFQKISNVLFYFFIIMTIFLTYTYIHPA